MFLLFPQSPGAHAVRLAFAPLGAPTQSRRASHPQKLRIAAFRISSAVLEALV